MGSNFIRQSKDVVARISIAIFSMLVLIIGAEAGGSTG